MVRRSNGSVPPPGIRPDLPSLMPFDKAQPTARNTTCARANATVRCSNFAVK